MKTQTNAIVEEQINESVFDEIESSRKDVEIMATLSNEQIRKTWQKMLYNVDKYFHRPIVNEEMQTREFVVSSAKSWAFDMLNKVLINYDVKNGEYIDYYERASVSKGISRTFVFMDDDKEYRMHCKPYLNGNTLITITIQ